MKRKLFILLSAMVISVPFTAQAEPSSAACAVISAAANHQTKADVSKYNTDGQTLLDECMYLVKAEPSMFAVNGNIQMTTKGKKADTVLLKYDYSAETAAEMKAFTDKTADDIAGKAQAYKSDYEQAKFVYEYLIDNFDYDWTLSQFKEYELFSTGTGVCEAYSIAYKDVLDRLGIPCEIVISKEIKHQWNVVKIDGEWYNVDCAWGDTEYADGGSRLAEFAKSDVFMQIMGHTGGETDIVCTSGKYDDII